MSRYEIRYNEKLLKHYFYDNELKEQISFDDVLKVIEEQNNQLAEKDKELKDAEEHIDNLELQLREQYQLVDEKDNEIKVLKEETKMLESWKETYYKYWQEEKKKRQELQYRGQQQIRHQVCDEIRAFFDVNPDVVDFDYLNEILNQIERGERQ